MPGAAASIATLAPKPLATAVAGLAETAASLASVDSDSDERTRLGRAAIGAARNKRESMMLRNLRRTALTIKNARMEFCEKIWHEGETKKENGAHFMHSGARCATAHSSCV